MPAKSNSAQVSDTLVRDQQVAADFKMVISVCSGPIAKAYYTFDSYVTVGELKAEIRKKPQGLSLKTVASNFELRTNTGNENAELQDASVIHRGGRIYIRQGEGAVVEEVLEVMQVSFSSKDIFMPRCMKQQGSKLTIDYLSADAAVAAYRKFASDFLMSSVDNQQKSIIKQSMKPPSSSAAAAAPPQRKADDDEEEVETEGPAAAAKPAKPQDSISRAHALAKEYINNDVMDDGDQRVLFRALKENKLAKTVSKQLRERIAEFITPMVEKYLKDEADDDEIEDINLYMEEEVMPAELVPKVQQKLALDEAMEAKQGEDEDEGEGSTSEEK